MDLMTGGCPLSGQQLLDEYFIENRTRVLDLAAFLDRLERASDGGGQDDFRLAALCEALLILTERGPGRTERIQMAFSDPRPGLRPALDRQSACGAYRPEEV